MWEKFGVAPSSIPDYLGLVGDTADGIPGLPGWGAKSAGAVLAHYRTIEEIPDDVEKWAVKVRSAARLAQTLAKKQRRQNDGELVLRDVGSSNGTYVDGARITLATLKRGKALRVEFGVGGPVLRLFLGDDDEISNLPEPELEPLEVAKLSGHRVIIGALIALIVAALAAIWWRFSN